jgi:hypothetical protein
MLSAAQSKHLFSIVTSPALSNESIEMLRLRCAALSMTGGTRNRLMNSAYYLGRLLRAAPASVTRALSAAW